MLEYNGTTHGKESVEVIFESELMFIELLIVVDRPETRLQGSGYWRQGLESLSPLGCDKDFAR